MGQRSAIFGITLVGVLANGLALPRQAHADLALWFASARAHWGERVVVRSPGRYAAVSGVGVYLVPMALARSARVQRPTGPPTDRRIVALGELRLERRAVARVSFVVPRVRPGDYTIGFWCKPCAAPPGAFFTTARPHQHWRPNQRRIVRISRSSCRAPLPRGRAVPAPIVFTTGCGGFRLNADGRVDRLPRGWLSAHAGGTGRRWGADLQIRRNRAGRIFILRRGRLVWRSRDLYPNTGDQIAFGPNAFAFASYHRGVFLTDLRGPERLVFPGRARYPHDFFPSGRLIVTGGRAIVVLSPGGRVERRYPYSRSHGYSFDERSDTLFFVTPRGRLATLRESRLRVGRRLNIAGTISVTPQGPLLFAGARSLALASRDGRVLAGARWPRSRLSVFDSGAAVSADGRDVAFRLSDARPGAQNGNAVLFLLATGQRRAHAVYRHHLGPVGCGTGARMYWHGRHLLYGSADGQLAILDAASGRRRDLSRLAQVLPRRAAADRPAASWASDYERR